MEAVSILLDEHVARATCNLPFKLAKSTFNEYQLANRQMERGIINSIFTACAGNFPFKSKVRGLGQ